MIRKKTQQNQKQTEQIGKFIRGILSDLENENIRTFVIDIENLTNHKAVATLFIEYLRDQTMKELAYKEYKILGKVVHKVRANDNNTIDLLRGTGMGGIGRSALLELFTGLERMPGMELPKVETSIDGPAIEIIPIAIYV